MAILAVIPGALSPPGAEVYAAPYAPWGIVFFGTSNSEVDLGDGQRLFVMNEFNLGFFPGMRLRAAVVSALGSWIEGVCISYLPTTNELIISSDLYSGGGIYNDWSITITGEPGIEGPAGGARPATALPLIEGSARVGVSLKYAREDHVHPAGGGTGGPPPATTLPIIEGVATVGVSLNYARADHVHPTGGDSASGIYLPLDGSQPMTGPLVGTDADFSGLVTATGGFSCDTPTVTNHGFGMSVAGSARWSILTTGTAEGAGNVGSDFTISSYAGTKIGDPLSIRRSDSVVSVNGLGAAGFVGPSAAGVARLALNCLRTVATPQCDIVSTKSGALRWTMSLGNTTAETGGNLGSDFGMASYNDAGAWLGPVMNASRSNRIVTFAKPIVNGSDRRLKSNVASIEGALALVEQLQGVSYDPIDGGQHTIGLIAQDVQAVLPEVVFETPPDPNDPVQTKDEPLLGIAYGNCVAVLIEALKELSARVKTLEATGGEAVKERRTS